MIHRNENDKTVVVEFEYSGENAPERLDQYIGHKSDLNLSRTRAQKLIENGLIIVNGKKALHHLILRGGEKICITIPPPPVSEILPEEIPLKIVFEDEYLFVIDKPAGIVTHPGPGNVTGTLVNAVMNYSRNLSSLSGSDRPGIVHRLDKDTSGLIIIAKNDDVHLKLQTALKERKIKKIYVALICGHMKELSGVINLPVGRSTRDRKKMAVTRLKGREALTEYKLVKRYGLYDLLEVNLLTGRTHQIRIHFSHLGHPVFGDANYGGRLKWHLGIFSAEKQLALRALEIMRHQALHARSLEFVHPATGKNISLSSDLPEDFKALLALLEKEGV